MPERYHRSLFVFRRDLRIDDNTALMEALNRSDEVIPCFIFDPRLSGKSKKNFNHNAFQFMVESLEDLKKQFKERNGKMYFLSGLPEDVIGKLIRKMKIDAVFVNADYTPFSRKRDEEISNVCSASGAAFHQFHDSLLHEPGTALTKKGTPYVVFTQFFRASSKMEVPLPVMVQRVKGVQSVQGSNFYAGKLDMADTDIPVEMKIPENKQIFVRGGRSNALAVLEDLAAFKNYDHDRDYPSLQGTTGLSAHNKFGTISIREFYHSVRDELGAGHTLINELHWRDFFTHVASEFPHVFTSAFKQKYDGILWDNAPESFNAWCSGKTGYPIVDAGMRELNTTGFMHNRVRMITASFLVKDLHIDWRLGERYFASKLVDYDPCVNNGNWQWSASTGADAQPFFRIFNPWLQQKKYDPDCEYIRKWLPELGSLDAASIHKLEKRPPPEDVDYPPQIVDHAVERNRSLVMFRSMR
ncbi:MAG: deoxyribodipyrimidine photo-lyase [Methanosarcinaceae archaeon]|nr:deoxyribodipyrimidine photo-lyase [Methanosarcinaceae archaeon]